MTPTLSDLEELARAAGDILFAGFKNHNNIQHKGEINLVTEIDQQSEAYLLGEIKRRFPGHSIIAEESGKHAGDPQHIWYVDPLDGTTNFAHGLPIFSVSIGYAQSDNLTLGIVYDPIQEELFAATKGQGAYLNDKPIHTGNQEKLSRSLLCTGFPYDRFTNPVNNLDNFAKFSLKAQGVRRLGSAALDLCYVAAGRLDGFWELRLYPWDMAAGKLIAEEAGAKVTKFNGDPHLFNPPYSIIAANPKLHREMEKVLHDAEF
jgi:myo-inositol-1(or 4)-monophosphatase